MGNFVISLLELCAVLTISGLCNGAAKKEKIIACYFTNWAQYRSGIGKFTPDNIDPRLCTHVFFAFAKINVSRNTLDSIEWNYRSALLPGVMRLKDARPGLKAILSVGGYNAALSGWLGVTSQTKVDAFAANVVTYLRRDGFDGVDIDWETPDASTQANYIRLMKALRNAIDAEKLKGTQDRLLLFTDVVTNKRKLQYYSPSTLERVVDYVILMAYDFYGSWSKVIGHHSALFLQESEPEGSFFSQHQGVEMWRGAGVPLDKLVLGLAGYGRALEMTSLARHNPGDSFTGIYPNGAPYTKEKGFFAFYEVCNLTKDEGWTEHFLTDARVPYVYGKRQGQLVWIGYDNARSIKDKSEYILVRGLAGAMIWALDQDDFTGAACGTGERYPLLSAINTVFLQTAHCSVDSDCSGKHERCINGFCACSEDSYLFNKQFCKDGRTPTSAPTLTPTPTPGPGENGTAGASAARADLWMSACSLVPLLAASCARL